MAKNPNKKAKALQKDEQMNGAMKFFLAGCVAELYLLIIRRFYINADSELSRIAWYDRYLWMLAGIGAVGVSVLELGTGLACRRLLHVEVWDYSQEWGNLAGLVCPKYTALWFLLCLWVLGMMRFLRGFAAYVARTKA